MKWFFLDKPWWLSEAISLRWPPATRSHQPWSSLWPAGYWGPEAEPGHPFLSSEVHRAGHKTVIPLGKHQESQLTNTGHCWVQRSKHWNCHLQTLYTNDSSLETSMRLLALTHSWGRGGGLSDVQISPPLQDRFGADVKTTCTNHQWTWKGGNQEATVALWN